MTADLTLLCHGPTRATRLAAFPADEELHFPTAVPGADPAASFRRATQVWVSPARRARQTADLLGFGGAGVEPALGDCDYGLWAGRTIAEISEEDPDGFARWLGEPDAAPHGGEPLAGVIARVGVWLGETVSASGRLLAITHASVIRAAVLSVLGAPPTAFWQVDIEPLGAVRLRSDGRRWALRIGG